MLIGSILWVRTNLGLSLTACNYNYANHFVPQLIRTTILYTLVRNLETMILSDNCDTPTQLTLQLTLLQDQK